VSFCGEFFLGHDLALLIFYFVEFLTNSFILHREGVYSRADHLLSWP